MVYTKKKAAGVFSFESTLRNYTFLCDVFVPLDFIDRVGNVFPPSKNHFSENPNQSHQDAFSRTQVNITATEFRDIKLIEQYIQHGSREIAKRICNKNKPGSNPTTDCVKLFIRYKVP